MQDCGVARHVLGAKGLTFAAKLSCRQTHCSAGPPWEGCARDYTTASPQGHGPVHLQGGGRCVSVQHKAKTEIQLT